MGKLKPETFMILMVETMVPSNPTNMVNGSCEGEGRKEALGVYYGNDSKYSSKIVGAKLRTSMVVLWVSLMTLLPGTIE